MKKIIIVAIALVIMVISACQGQKHCPAYDSIDGINEGITVPNLINL